MNDGDAPLARLFDVLDISPDDFWAIAGASAWRRFDEVYCAWIAKGLAEEAIWDVVCEDIPPEPRRLQPPETFEPLIKERSHVYASPTRRLFYETKINPDQFWQTPGAPAWRGFDDIYGRWIARGFCPISIWHVLHDNRPERGHLKPPRHFDPLIRLQTIESEAGAAASIAYDDTYDRAYAEAEQRLDALA